MAEVDYSRFYYSRERNETPAPPEPDRGGRKGGGKRRSGKPFLIFAVIAVVFAIVFLCADFFTEGKLIDSIAVTLRGNTYEYYLVASENSSRDLAYAQSLLVKQGGGGGYIISEKEKFLVIYAVYTERTEASSVASKNPNTFVHTVGFSGKNAKVFNAADKAVRGIADSVGKLESGGMTESEFYGVLTDARKEILAVKTEIIDAGTAAEINLLEFIMGSIDGLEVSKGTRANFLSDVRYMLAGIVVSMSKAVG